MSTPTTELATTSPRIITVNLPEKSSMDTRAMALQSAANELIVDSTGMAEIAADELRFIKLSWRNLEEQRKVHVGPLNEEVDYINDYYRPALALLKDAEATYKAKVLAYTETLERAREKEQLRIQNERRAERSRLELENKEADRVALAEAESKLAEQAEAIARENAARVEADTLLEQARAAVNAGNKKLAEELIAKQKEAVSREAEARAVADYAGREATDMLTVCAEHSAASEVALVCMTPAVVTPIRKLSGISTKTVYKGKCENLLELVQFIAKNPQYINLVKANDMAINAHAKAQEASSTVAGLLIWQDKTIAARRA